MKALQRIICLALLGLLPLQAYAEPDVWRQTLARAIERVRDLEEERSDLLARHETQQALLSGRAMREQLPAEPDPLLAWSYNDAGLLMTQEGQLDMAALLFDRALAVLSDTFAADHPARGTVLQNAAEVLWLQRKPEAFERFAEAGALFEKLDAGAHPRFGALLNSWAGAKVEAGQLPEAEELYRRSIRVYAASASEDAVAPLYNLAVMCMRFGRTDEAAALLGQAREHLQRAGEQQSSRMVFVLRAMSQNANLQGNSREAARLERQAQRIVDAESL